jgi:hypothetical protein
MAQVVTERGNAIVVDRALIEVLRLDRIDVGDG